MELSLSIVIPVGRVDGSGYTWWNWRGYPSLYLVTISMIEWEEEKRGSLGKCLLCLCVHHIIFWEIGLGNGGALNEG